jgi:hypothetical protein
VCYMSCPSHPPWFVRPDYIRWRVTVMRLLNVQYYTHKHIQLHNNAHLCVSCDLKLHYIACRKVEKLQKHCRFVPFEIREIINFY